MLIKAGVDISRLNREIRRSLLAVDQFVKDFQEELIITSTYEGNHMSSSLHYSNDAYDFRRPSTVHNGTLKLLRGMLGDDYDIIWHHNHIHIEYDPKGD